jgi:REP element-mobilizing transposase RayT
MAIDIQKNLVRKSLRLKGYDYSQPGAYFITICTENKVCYLGNVVDGITISYPISDIIRDIWQEIPEKFQGVDLDAFIIMPNHVHGIVVIKRECKDMIQQAHIDNNENIREGVIHQMHIKDYAEDMEVSFINQTLTNNFIKNNKVGLMNQAPTKNHFHGKNGSLMNRAPKKNQADPKPKNWNLMLDSNQTVGKIVRYFKAKTAKIVHDRFFPSFQWQRNYYERTVRSPRELDSIREYIINNPLKWALDRENRLSKNFNMDLENYFKDIFDK